MARHTRHWRPPFDPALEYVATPASGRAVVRIMGVEYAHGETIDKSAVPPRRLRQMYEQRIIKRADGQESAPAAPKPAAVGPTDLHHPGLEGQPGARRGVKRRRLART